MSEVLTEPGIIRHGDYLVNEATGEITGLAVDQEAPFRVHDQSSAEWVLEKLHEAESQVAAIAARRSVLLANLEAMERPIMHRVEWLRMRFGRELEEWAKRELAGQKVRSVRTPFGALSFRKVKAQLVVDDEKQAAAWAKAQAPEAVKVTEKFLVSRVPAGAVPPGCHIAPARESFTVKTGVE